MKLNSWYLILLGIVISYSAITYQLLLGPLFIRIRPQFPDSSIDWGEESEFVRESTIANSPFRRYYVWSIEGVFNAASEGGQDQIEDTITEWLDGSAWVSIPQDARWSCSYYQSEQILPSGTSIDLAAKPDGWDGSEGGLPTICFSISEDQSDGSSVVGLSTITPGPVAAIFEMGQ